MTTKAVLAQHKPLTKSVILALCLVGELLAFPGAAAGFDESPREKTEREAAEKKLLQNCREGKPVEFERDEPRTVRAACLREAILGHPGRPQEAKAIRISGAVIVDRLCIEREEVRQDVTLKSCDFQGEVHMSHAHFQ